MIFWGPPGTGKTLFAKAIAASIGAAITIVSGPGTEESKWVGESEENLRQIFHQARQSAPSIIVFDETRFVRHRPRHLHRQRRRALDGQPAAHRDGRLPQGRTRLRRRHDELRRDRSTPPCCGPAGSSSTCTFRTRTTTTAARSSRSTTRRCACRSPTEALEYAVRRTGENYMTATGTPFSGDHLNALCRSVARLRLREDIKGETTPKLIERGLTEFDEKVELHGEGLPRWSRSHEAGHFLVLDLLPEPRAAREGHHPERHAVGAVLHAVQARQAEDRPFAATNCSTSSACSTAASKPSGSCSATCPPAPAAFGDPRSDLSRASDLAEHLRRRLRHEQPRRTAANVPRPRGRSATCSRDRWPRRSTGR